MLRLENENYSEKFTYSLWFLMAFQAGYVNVGGLFTSGNFVSHVTGTSSQIGMGLARFDLVILATFCTVLLAFITGAAFSGHFIGRLKEEGKEPQYVLVMGVKAFFFGLVLLLSGVSWSTLLGVNQDAINLLIIFFLSFCCGVQNSTCALSTNGFLKPTHMTGLSTDIGIFLTKINAWDQKSPKFQEEHKKNILRVCILGSFIFGGVVSTMIFSHNGHYGFLYPFVSSLCFFAMAIMRDVQKIGVNTISFNAMKGSILVVFITTLLFGINGFVRNFN